MIKHKVIHQQKIAPGASTGGAKLVKHSVEDSGFIGIGIKYLAICLGFRTSKKSTGNTGGVYTKIEIIRSRMKVESGRSLRKRHKKNRKERTGTREADVSIAPSEALSADWSILAIIEVVRGGV